jgi:hypothetical protein
LRQSSASTDRIGSIHGYGWRHAIVDERLLASVLGQTGIAQEGDSVSMCHCLEALDQLAESVQIAASGGLDEAAMGAGSVITISF